MSEISDETMKELQERVDRLNGHLMWLKVDILEKSETINVTLDGIERDCTLITKSVEKAREDLGIEPASA